MCKILYHVSKHLLRNNTKTERQGSVNLFHSLLSHTLLYFLILLRFCKISSNFSRVSLNSFTTSSTFPRLQIKTQLTVVSVHNSIFRPFRLFKAVFVSFAQITLYFMDLPIFLTHFGFPKWLYKSGFHCIQLFIACICSMVLSVIVTNSL